MTTQEPYGRIAPEDRRAVTADLERVLVSQLVVASLSILREVVRRY